MGVKEQLVEKNNQKTKLTKGMNIADMINVLKPEIEKALPKVITPERFTRMALSAVNTTPKLAECSQITFLSALMNAAQLGLEPNTPLGQKYMLLIMQMELNLLSSDTLMVEHLKYLLLQ